VVTVSTREAFLGNLAEGGILFEGGPVDGREQWEQRPEGGAVLVWDPEIADVSGAGDMGYTSGPWEVRSAPGAAPAGWGHFVTVWRRDSTGVWKVAIDGGNVHDSVPVVVGSPVEDVGSHFPILSGADEHPDHSRQMLITADAAYSNSIGEAGYAGSLDRFADPSVRFLRNGSLPILGRDSARVSAAVTQTVLTNWRLRGGDVALSADIGYTYGDVQIEFAEAPSDWVRPAGYFRVWRKDSSSEWRVMIDVLIPDAP